MLGGHSGLEPPLPISNRAVKRTSANDSMLLACESRSLPSYLYQKPHYERSGVFLRLYACGACLQYTVAALRVPQSPFSL